MSHVTVIKKWLASRPQPSGALKADVALIDREKLLDERRQWKRDIRNRLQETDVPASERDALHAQLRVIARAEGLRDDLIFNGGVMRKQE